MTVKALSIIQSLPDFQPDITGVVLLYGGKCFDITLANPEAATHLATAGYDYESTVKPLGLLGPKNIHVSIFVFVELLDDQLIPLLKQQGHLKSDQPCDYTLSRKDFNTSNVESTWRNLSPWIKTFRARLSHNFVAVWRIK